VEDGDRDGGAKAEQREVEGDLDHRLAAIDEQHPDRPGEDGEQHRRRVGEDQAEHERQLAQREDVDVAAKRDVHDAHLGHREGDREHPPGGPRARAERREMAQVGEREREGAGSHRADERPHARRPAGAQPQQARASRRARRTTGPLDAPLCDAAAHRGHEHSIRSPVFQPTFRYRSTARRGFRAARRTYESAQRCASGGERSSRAEPPLRAGLPRSAVC
jgi:hypothetical protein